MSADKVTYGYYEDSFGGTAIEEDDWPGYEARARAHFCKFDAQYAMTPYGDGEEAYKATICDMAEKLQGFDLMANGEAGANSASIGSVSVSFGKSYSESVDLSDAGQELALLKCAQLRYNVFAGLR
jgi:hypothetical protein